MGGSRSPPETYFELFNLQNVLTSKLGSRDGAVVKGPTSHHDPGSIPARYSYMCVMFKQ